MSDITITSDDANMTDAETECRLAVAIATHPLTMPLHFYMVLMCICSSFASLFVLFGCWHCKPFHPHVRVIVVNISVALLLTSTFQTVNSLGLIYKMSLSYKNECDYGVSFTPCCYAYCTKSIGVFAVVFSTLTIAIERLFATVKFRSYEGMNSLVVKVSTTSLQWVLPLVIMGPSYAKADSYTLYCSMGYFARLNGNQIYFVYAGISEVIACVMLITALVVNKRFDRNIKVHALSRGWHKLTERYQLTENIRMTKILLYIVAAYYVESTLHHFSNSIMDIFLSNGHDDAALKMVLYDWISSTSYWYAILVSAICINASPAMRQFFGSVLFRLTAGRLGKMESTISNLPRQQTNEEYYQTLTEMWKGGPINNNK